MSQTASMEQPLTRLPSQSARAIVNVRSTLLPEGKGWAFDSDCLDLVPNDAQRAWLFQRSEVLQAWLRPAGQDRARNQLASLVATMKRRSAGTPGDARKIIETYVVDLCDVPFFGLVEACTAFRRNSVGDGWLPTPGELRQEALLRAMWAQQELSDIRTIVGARVPDKPVSLEARQAAVERYREIIRPVLDHATEPNRKPLPEEATVVLPPASPLLRANIAAQALRTS